MTGCASADPPAATADDTEQHIAKSSSPFVGTWQWSASGKRIGDIELGDEEFVFRDDGTYAVVSKTADGWSECYEGTFTWSTGGEPGYATIVFKGSHVRASAGGGFERAVYLDGADTLVFGEGGTYRRTGPVVDVRCP
jgi:hypothetical protein